MASIATFRREVGGGATRPCVGPGQLLQSEAERRVALSALTARCGGGRSAPVLRRRRQSRTRLQPSRLNAAGCPITPGCPPGWPVPRVVRCQPRSRSPMQLRFAIRARLRTRRWQPIAGVEVSGSAQHSTRMRHRLLRQTWRPLPPMMHAIPRLRVRRTGQRWPPVTPEQTLRNECAGQRDEAARDVD